MTRPVLEIIVGSTRPGRVGLPVVRWFEQMARDHGAFDVEFVDLADVDLPLLDEPNHSYNAATKNALDYLLVEWRYKPVGFVSYGGVAAGTRAQTALKPVVSALAMVPVVEAVNVPFVARFVDDERVFVPNDLLANAATGLLAELVRVEEALRPLH